MAKKKQQIAFVAQTTSYSFIRTSLGLRTLKSNVLDSNPRLQKVNQCLGI